MSTPRRYGSRGVRSPPPAVACTRRDGPCRPTADGRPPRARPRTSRLPAPERAESRSSGRRARSGVAFSRMPDGGCMPPGSGRYPGQTPSAVRPRGVRSPVWYVPGPMARRRDLPALIAVPPPALTCPRQWRLLVDARRSGEAPDEPSPLYPAWTPGPSAHPDGLGGRPSGARRAAGRSAPRRDVATDRRCRARAPAPARRRDRMPWASRRSGGCGSTGSAACARTRVSPGGRSSCSGPSAPSSSATTGATRTGSAPSPRARCTRDSSRCAAPTACSVRITPLTGRC